MCAYDKYHWPTVPEAILGPLVVTSGGALNGGYFGTVHYFYGDSIMPIAWKTETLLILL